MQLQGVFWLQQIGIGIQAAAQHGAACALQHVFPHLRASSRTCSPTTYVVRAGVGLRPQQAAGAAQPMERAATKARAPHGVNHCLQGRLGQAQQGELGLSTAAPGNHAAGTLYSSENKTNGGRETAIWRQRRVQWLQTECISKSSQCSCGAFEASEAWGPSADPTDRLLALWFGSAGRGNGNVSDIRCERSNRAQPPHAGSAAVVDAVRDQPEAGRVTCRQLRWRPTPRCTSVPVCSQLPVPDRPAGLTVNLPLVHDNQHAPCPPNDWMRYSPAAFTMHC